MFILSSLMNIHIFGAWGIYGWYIQRYMSAFPIFYATTTSSTFPTFMLSLLFQISIFDFYIIKLILCMIIFYGRLYEPIAVYPDLKNI